MQNVVQSVVDELPDHFLDDLFRKNTLRVHVQSLNESLTASDMCAYGDKTFGKYDRRRKRIVVSEKLVLLARANDNNSSSDFDCNHRTFARALRATITHELAHVYDRQHEVSETESFARLAGGETRWKLRRKSRVGNYNYASSPDVYEFESLRESFAVNFEYYLLDQDFRCARPAFASVFDRTFSVEEAEECRSHKTVLLHSNIVGDNLTRTTSISAEDVYEVHYLFAFKGSSIASKWGHGMFRLVTCAPYRTEVGPECLEDSANHIVLSYRANVADLTINYAKGLFGAYPSQLFVYELPEIIKEYTRLEFRDLISVPLKLTLQEKDKFLRVALERYWNYESKYYFVTNHCGTEALNHLRATEDGIADGVRSRTPRKLLRTLHRADLVDRKQYDSILRSDSANAFFFPSKKPLYNAAFHELRRHGLFEAQSLDKFISKSEAEDRNTHYSEFLATDIYRKRDLPSRRRIVSNMLLLERLQQAHEQDRIANEAMRLLLKSDKSLLDSLRISLPDLFRTPWQIVNDDRYGVPSEEAIQLSLESSKMDTGDKAALYDLLEQHEPLSDVISRLDMLGRVEQLLELELLNISGTSSDN